VLDELGRRFNYHFYGDRPTNSNAKPEWFFTQLSVWISNNIDYFDENGQNFVDDVSFFAAYEIKLKFNV